MARKFTVARVLTFVFDVPIVAMFSFTMFYLFKSKDLLSFLITLVFIGIVPLFAWAYLLKHPGDYKGERKVSFIIDAVSYSLALILLLILKRRNIYAALSLSYVLNVLVLIVINKLGYKASGHGAGIGGPATALAFEFGGWGALSFFLLVPVGYAKVKLGDHTVGQFATGALVSAVITYLSFALFGVL